MTYIPETAQSISARILLYDDDPDIRGQVKSLLESGGVDATCAIEVVAPEDKWVAIEMVRQDPDGFNFILIDHVFRDIEEGSVLDLTEDRKPTNTGLELCHRLSRINPNIPIILYTTVREDAPDEIEAVAMGASRVVMQVDLPRLVSELQEDLRDLSEIWSRLQEIQLSRRDLSHVIGGLAVGFHVIDRHGHIWFQDDVFRRVVGDSGLPYEICYARVHGYDVSHGVCPNCLVHRVIGSGESDMSLAYSPTYPGGAGTRPVFQYLSVLTSPIYGKGDSPIAAIEAVSRAPQSQIDRLPLIEHLDILASGLQDMGFQRVRIYRADKTRTSKTGVVCEGPIGDNVSFTTVSVPLSKEPKLDDSELGSLVQIVDEYEYVDMDPERRMSLAFKDGHKPVCVALFDATGTFIGWVALDNGIYPVSDPKSFVPATDADLTPPPIGEHVRPSPLKMIEEIARTLASKPLAHAASTGDAGDVATAERFMERVRMRIAGDVTESSLPVINRMLDAVQKEVPELDMAHVRSIEDGRKAVLIASVGDYGARADSVVDIRLSKRVTARVARTGVPEYISTLDEVRKAAGVDEFSADQRSILLQRPSHAAYPLLDEGQIVGTVTFQSKVERFFEGYRRHLFQFVADLLSKALHDHLALARERERVAVEISQQAAALVVHNVGGSVGGIRNCTLLARELLRTDPAAVMDYLARIDEYCNQIGRIREDFLNAFGHTDDEPETIDLQRAIDRTVRRVVTDPQIDVEFERNPAIGEAVVRQGTMDACLEVVCRNAVDAILEVGHGGVVQIIARHPEDADHREKDFAHSCVAVDVIDNGVGISSDIKPRLFEMFFSSKSDGLGFGLAYARQTMRASGGDVYLADEDTRGTRFTVLLPISSGDTKGGRK